MAQYSIILIVRWVFSVVRINDDTIAARNIDFNEQLNTSPESVAHICGAFLKFNCIFMKWVLDIWYSDSVVDDGNGHNLSVNFMLENLI